LALADNAFLVVWFVNFSLWDLVVYVGLEPMNINLAQAYERSFLYSTEPLRNFSSIVHSFTEFVYPSSLLL